MDIIRFHDEFVLVTFVEPRRKVYYVSNDDNGIHCSSSLLSAFRFVSRNNAVCIAENMKMIFDVDFTIQKVEV